MGCSTVRQVRPLEPGDHSVAMSVGGPLFSDLGFPIPVPVISVDYQYGLLDGLSVGGAFHITPVFFGLFGMIETNVTVGLMDQTGFLPATSLHVNCILLSDFSTSWLVFPELGIVPSWNLTDEILLYVGATALVNLYPKTSGLPKDSYVIPSFLVGSQLGFGNLAVTAECRLSNPFASNADRGVHFMGIGAFGAFAPYVSVSYTFGGER